MGEQLTAALFTGHELHGDGPRRFLREARPDVVAGHGFGDLVALVAAGVLDLRAARKLAGLRERLITQANVRAPGGLLAVLDPDADVAAARIARRSGVCIARHDSPTRTIVAGTHEQLDRARLTAGELGIWLAEVRAPAALHSALMHRAARRFACALTDVELRTPRIPVYTSLTAATIGDPRADLSRGLEQPVLWVQTVRALVDAGVARFAEADPGHVLGDLTYEILSVPNPAAADRPIAA